MSSLVIIFAKEPVAGKVKTRLSPPLSLKAAAELYHSFLIDILQEMALLPDTRLALAYDPLGARDFFAALAGPDILLFPQEGRGLGERMHQALAYGVAAGFANVLLRGSDTPDLPAAVVAEGQAALANGTAQVVLGPALDGGYYIIGLSSPHPELFQGITWSDATVFGATRDKARRLGLPLHLLPAWRDIDNPEDLLALARQEVPEPQPGWRSAAYARQLLHRAGQIL